MGGTAKSYFRFFEKYCSSKKFLPYPLLTFHIKSSSVFFRGPSQQVVLPGAYPETMFSFSGKGGNNKRKAPGSASYFIQALILT